MPASSSLAVENSFRFVDERKEIVLAMSRTVPVVGSDRTTGSSDRAIVVMVWREMAPHRRRGIFLLNAFCRKQRVSLKSQIPLRYKGTLRYHLRSEGKVVHPTLGRDVPAGDILRDDTCEDDRPITFHIAAISLIDYLLGWGYINPQFGRHYCCTAGTACVHGSIAAEENGGIAVLET